jgi:hypothetical protein
VNFNVIGYGLDSLVTSYLLLEKGHEVTLYSGGNKLAGHFAGLKNDHSRFDVGMVLLEKEDRGESQVDISEYKNEFGYRSRKFLLQTFFEIQRILGEYEPHKIKTLLSNGTEEADYFISDNLEAFNYLKNGDQAAFMRNIVNITEGQVPEFTHPKMKWDAELFEQNSVSLNLEIMYGKNIYQEYFGKFLNALVGSSKTTLPMRFHRKVWIPLYYPESFLPKTKQFSNEVSPLEFFRFKNISVATSIEKLIFKLNKNAQFKLINTPFAQFSGEVFKSKQSIYFLSINDLNKFISIPSVQDFSLQMSQELVILNSNSIKFLHVCIPAAENKTVFLQDPVSGLFRYSIYNSIENNLSTACFEFGSGAPETLDGMIQIVRSFLDIDKILCEGQLNSINFVQKYHSIGINDWNRMVLEVSDSLKSPSDIVHIVHPEGLSINDNFTRGLAAASRI